MSRVMDRQFRREAARLRGPNPSKERRLNPGAQVRDDDDKSRSQPGDRQPGLDLPTITGALDKRRSVVMKDALPIYSRSALCVVKVVICTC